MNRDIPSAFAENAGEFFVLAELTRRGWTAGLTARNNRAYDIVATRDESFASIRVKSKKQSGVSARSQFLANFRLANPRDQKFSTIHTLLLVTMARTAP